MTIESHLDSNMNDSTIADTTSNSVAINGDQEGSGFPEGEELRKEGDLNYSTKQQDKAANGPDGIDQYELARAQVNKVAKSVNQDNIQLRKEVSLALIKASTVFITYLSAAAYDKTQEAGNKIISAQHVLSAFKELGFPDHYYKQLKKEYNEKVNPETSKSSKPNQQTNGEENEDGTAMDVDQTSTIDQERGLGDESMAVGDETLAAVDAARQDDEEEEEDEVEEEVEGGNDED